MNIAEVIAEELSVRQAQVTAAIDLLDNDATVPFIARYRKEVTGGLDDSQLRTLDERLKYLRELQERKQVVIKSIDEQGKLTSELEDEINKALTKSKVEDLYLPYKKKLRTKSQIAIEAGLEPLALGLLSDQNQDPTNLAESYLNPEKNINDTEQALAGAKYILMDLLSENPEVTEYCRNLLWQDAILKSEVIDNTKQDSNKFNDYFEYSESIKTIPSHRALALFRGRQLDVLKLSIELTEDAHEQCKNYIANKFDIAKEGFNASQWLWGCVEWAWKIKLLTRLELDAYNKLRESAEEIAVKVFSENLQNLLMAAPAGSKVTMGLDPGYRTGVKVAIVDKTGKLLDHIAIFPHAPQNQWNQALHVLSVLCKKHQVELISIGNGTASRETDKLALELIKANSELKMTKIVVSEAGASVYSASELAAKEFPDLDVSYRGAVSIARRLQDPLAELVKVEPKSIGVGQYQHDVNQYMLARNLDNTVEDCVNRVGVDVNMASVPLLAKISGLNHTLANNIVEYRNAHGAFSSRESIKQVPRMGEKTFQQCAGFLRIANGSNPLDASAVHPESYPIVIDILNQNKINIKDIKNIIGNQQVLNKLNPEDYVNDIFGLPTVKDIILELNKPGRDPRPEFKTAEFKDGVEELKDLKPGMRLEGVVTNVTPFGAFVDIGVHQDGLVHKSMMADRFVENPNEIVKVGQIVNVRVLEVDINRKRISLTMKETTECYSSNNSNSNNNASKSKGRQKGKYSTSTKTEQEPMSAMAEAFARALGKK